MAGKCECTGAVCVCGAEGVVKDGAAVRVSSMTMDSAPSSTVSISDRAATSRYDDVRGLAVNGMDAPTYFATMDAAFDGAEGQKALAARDFAFEGQAASKPMGDVEARIFGDCVAKGMSDHDARREAAFQALCQRDQNAHRRVA